jgi:hypothetical protein
VTGARQRVRAWAAELRPRTIAIAGWLVFLLYAYPGYMTSDSINQLLDSRVGTFNDWHSPVMTEVWRLIGFAIAGPFGMLALQSLLVIAGAHALLARITTPRRAALGAVGLLVFPPVMVTMAAIWQDSQMAGFLLAGLAAITSRRRGWQLAGLGLLVLASAMRPSAAFAVLPILVLGWSWRPAIVGRRRIALALAAWAAVWLGAIGLDAGLRDKATGHTRLELAISDVLGVLHYAPAFDDARARELLDGVPLQGTELDARAAAAYRHPNTLTSGPDRLFDPPQDADDRAPVIAAEYRLALAYPGAYLKHRWHTWFRVLGVHRTGVGKPVYTGFSGSITQSDEAAHIAWHSAVQRGAIAVVSPVAKLLCWPYLYLIAALVLLPVALRRRQILPAILLASGVAYELSLFVVAIGSQYALSHWLVTTTSFAVALMIRDAVSARKARAAAPAPAAAAAA